MKIFRKRFYHYKLYMSSATGDIAEGMHLAIMFSKFARLDPANVVRSMMHYGIVGSEDGVQQGSDDDFTDVEIVIK